MECNGKKTKVESCLPRRFEFCSLDVDRLLTDDVAWLCPLVFQGADKLTLSGRDTEKGERKTLVLMNIVNYISRKYSH